MSGERGVGRDDLLTSEERDNGFSSVVDDHHNTTLEKWGKPVAWFSAAETAEVLRGFLDLIKFCEGRKYAR